MTEVTSQAFTGRLAVAVRQFCNFYQWLTPPADKPLAPAAALHYNRFILQ